MGIASIFVSYSTVIVKNWQVYALVTRAFIEVV